MPKRTNDFQKLVYLVRVNLAEGATVTESKMLTDRTTKRKREVDVCIEGHVGGHPVIVSVECRDHKRIADVSWVDTMKAKHERLPTNALILASPSDFTPEAHDVAAGYGMQTFSLAAVDEVDFPKLLGATSSLWTKSVTVTTEKVLVKVLPTTQSSRRPTRKVFRVCSCLFRCGPLLTGNVGLHALWRQFRSMCLWQRRKLSKKRKTPNGWSIMNACVSIREGLWFWGVNSINDVLLPERSFFKPLSLQLIDFQSTMCRSKRKAPPAVSGRL
jgi:hypothetical protein